MRENSIYKYLIYRFLALAAMPFEYRVWAITISSSILIKPCKASNIIIHIRKRRTIQKSLEVLIALVAQMANA